MPRCIKFKVDCDDEIHTYLGMVIEDNIYVDHKSVFSRANPRIHDIEDIDETQFRLCVDWDNYKVFEITKKA